MLSSAMKAKLCELLNEEEKEKNMNLHDVKIMVGGKVYPAYSVNWIQTPDDYPRIDASTIVSPSNYVAPSTRYGSTTSALPTITNVIFNPPATIVFWSDKTKTVVKADYEDYDPEKGIAMAVSRKMLGDNKREYYNIFRHWLKRYEKQYPEGAPNIDDFFILGEWDGSFANY